MQSFHEYLIEVSEKAKALHLNERRITLESVDLVGELEDRKAWLFLNMSVERFAEYIGLTPSKYWKRAKVARLFRSFPDFRDMFERGETEISHLTLVYGKVTPANLATIFYGIKGKSKRDVEAFLSRVNCYGELSEERPTFDIYVRMGEEEHDLLMRARDVLAHSGHVPSNGEIIAQALDVLLDKKDPMRKAERATTRAERMKNRDGLEKTPGPAPGKVEPEEIGDHAASQGPAPGKVGAEEIDEGRSTALGNVGVGDIGDHAAESDPDQSGENPDGDLDDEATALENIRHFPSPRQTQAQRRAEEKQKREAIPMATRHSVWLRDGARCTFVNPDGCRCEARMMLEIDHIKMVCDGGGNEAENLQLKCRHHNQLAARAKLGYDYRDIARGRVAAHRR